MKLFSIFFSFLMLFQSVNINVCDISQIDEFIEHAQFHKEKYGDNFFVFISKHYGNLSVEHSKKHQEEKKEHENLPFNHNIQLVSLYLPEFGKADSSYDCNHVDIERTDNYFYQLFL